MGLTVGYETKNGLEIKKKYGQNVQNTQQNKTNSIKQQTSASVASLGNSPASDSFTSGITGNVGSGNTCTDGKDDGHISLFSKVANVAQGVVRSGANIIKAAVKHPVKALAMTAVGFVPVVGPVVLGGLAAYGAIQGAKEVVGAINLANSATNDADAKAAWEHIGSGAFTTALSVTGAKASAKSLNNQLNHGSSTVDVFREKGLSKETLSEAFKETKSNAKGFYDTAKAKLENIEKKYKEFQVNKGLGNGKKYVKDEFQNYTDKKRYGDKAGDVQRQRQEVNKTKQELADAQEALNKARSEGKKGTELETLKKNVAEAKGKLDGYKKGDKTGKYEKAEAEFKEATEKLDKNSADYSEKYNEAKTNFENRIKGKKQEYSEIKKQNTTKAQAKAEREAQVQATTKANKQAFETEKSKLTGDGYEFKVDENGNGVATKKGADGSSHEIKYEDYKPVSKKEMSNGATINEETFETTKSGVKKSTNTASDIDGNTTSRTADYSGKLPDGTDVQYKQVYKRDADGTMQNVETYTVDKETSKYTNGERTEGPELSFTQRQLYKYNAKHTGSDYKTIDSSVLYAQQAAAALNANRY